METLKNQGPETASIDRISNPNVTRRPPMTRTLVLLEEYLQALGSLRDLNKPRGFTETGNQITRHLEAAGLANWIANQIHLRKAETYLNRARAHCMKIAPAMNKLQETAKTSHSFRLEQILNVELLAIRLERELAYCSEDDEQTHHIQTAEQRLSQIQPLITQSTHSSIALRFDWEQTFLLALQPGHTSTAKTQATNLMRNVHVITQKMYHVRREEALKIRQTSLQNALRIGIEIELAWKMPFKPIRT